MRKGIYLRATLPARAASGAQSTLAQELQSAFAALNPKLTLQVKDIAAGEKKGTWKVLAYIEGEQKASVDFKPLASDALSRAINQWQTQNSMRSTGPVDRKVKRPKPMDSSAIEEVEHEDEESGVLLPPKRQMPASAVAAMTQEPTGAQAAVPPGGDRPAPPPTTFHQCPAVGTGGDPNLSRRKNRTDKSKKTGCSSAPLTS
jgi:hypothetical protein